MISPSRRIKQLLTELNAIVEQDKKSGTMGWTVVKIDENGNKEKKLSNDFEILNFDNLDLEKFKLIRYLDPYGDTTFGARQYDDLVADLSKLEKSGQVKSRQLEELLVLVRECKKEAHTYLKFYGD